jgi:hypothetical protein
MAEGDEAVPDHCGEVVVGGVFGSGYEWEGELGAVLVGETLEGGGEGEADECGGIGGGEAGEGGDEGVWNFGFGSVRRALAHEGIERPFVGEEADGPGAEVFVGVF